MVAHNKNIPFCSPMSVQNNTFKASKHMWPDLRKPSVYACTINRTGLNRLRAAAGHFHSSSHTCGISGAAWYPVIKLGYSCAMQPFRYFIYSTHRKFCLHHTNLWKLHALPLPQFLMHSCRHITHNFSGLYTECITHYKDHPNYSKWKH